MRFLPRAGPTASMMSATLIVAGGGIAVKACGLLKLVFAAYLFGTSDAQDAFLAAFLLPSVLTEVLAASISPVLIPALLRAPPEGQTAETIELYRAALGSGAAVMSAAAVLVALLAPIALPLLASGFASGKLDLTRSLMYTLLPVLPLTACNAVWRSVLNARNRFALAAFAPLATPLISILVLYLAARVWGVYSMAAGTLAGCAIEAALLAQGVRRCGYPLIPRISGARIYLRAVSSQFAPIVLSALLFSCMPLIDNAMAAGLSPGSISVFGFGTKLSTVILSIGPAALSTAVLPQLSRMAAEREWLMMRRSLIHVAGLVLMTAIPLIAALILCSDQLVRVAFQKGAFSEQATLAVANVQRFSLLQIPIAAMGALGFRLASSLLANDLLIPAAGVGVAVTAIADLLLRRLLGVEGIALASLVTQLSVTVTLGLLLARRFKRVEIATL